jgi:hypothetical protein
MDGTSSWLSNIITSNFLWNGSPDADADAAATAAAAAAAASSPQSASAYATAGTADLAADLAPVATWARIILLLLLYLVFFLFSSPLIGNRDLRSSWSYYSNAATMGYLWIGASTVASLPIVSALTGYSLARPASLFAPLAGVTVGVLLLWDLALYCLRTGIMAGTWPRERSSRGVCVCVRALCVALSCVALAVAGRPINLIPPRAPSLPTLPTRSMGRQEQRQRQGLQDRFLAHHVGEHTAGGGGQSHVLRDLRAGMLLHSSVYFSVHVKSTFIPMFSVKCSLT